MPLTQDQIAKYRDLYVNSTNETVRNTAASKLKAEGVSLNDSTKVPKKKMVGTARVRPKKETQHDSIETFTKRIIKALKEKNKIAATAEMMNDKYVVMMIKEGYEEKWPAIYTAKQLVALMRKKEDHKGPEEYDCATLIADAKERAKTQKARREKIASQPKKTPATKNKEAIVKTSERTVKSMESRAAKGKVTPVEINKAIDAHKEAIRALEKLLKKVQSGKMEDGGNVGVTADDEAMFNKIQHDCGCMSSGGKMPTGSGWKHKRAKGGKIPNNEECETLLELADTDPIKAKAQWDTYSREAKSKFKELCDLGDAANEGIYKGFLYQIGKENISHFENNKKKPQAGIIPTPTETESLLDLAQNDPKKAKEIWNTYSSEGRKKFKKECEEDDAANEGIYKGFLYLISDRNPAMGEKKQKGGHIGFKALSRKVAAKYEGKKVPAKYQAEYGKTYDAKDAKSVGDKVAGKIAKEKK